MVITNAQETYFQLAGLYFTGDGAKRIDGYLRILGRVDDVINVSGHRMGTAEVENAINGHPKVIESAVVGFPREIKDKIYAYAICDMEGRTEEGLVQEIKDTVRKLSVQLQSQMKFRLSLVYLRRSGKIMRRILRKLQVRHIKLGDTSSLSILKLSIK